MDARRIGFWVGLAGLAAALLLPAPFGMPEKAWACAGLVWIMACWWMSEALPLAVTALLPFLILPLTGIADGNKAAAAYYTPIIFLFIGGAFMALAIERTGLHRRLALWVMGLAGPRPWQLLLAVMAATAALSAMISNTSTALIMMPMALAMLAAGGIKAGEKDGMAGALPMGVAFAASLGGLATIIGTPTNTIAAGLMAERLDTKIGFLDWAMYGVPMVLIAVPVAALIISRVHGLKTDHFDPAAARAAISHSKAWTTPEKRLVPLVVLALTLWIAQPWLEPYVPKNSVTDGAIAAAIGLLLFTLPDGTGRRMLNWQEANRAPWDVVLMFGGGLAMAMGMTESGLAKWLGEMLLPLGGIPLILLALLLVALVILITEFASNIAVASGIMPVVAALAAAIGADPILLALPAAIASTWGFMLPAGTGPNALAWSTGHISMPHVLKAGFLMDLIGVFLIVGVVWGVAALT